MDKGKILTKKALEVINKKLRNERLTQQDSNYLSRFVRPKLREMASIDALSLLRKLDYNPKSISIERKIKEIILKNIPKVEAIIICGSAIQTNYREYRDIDVIVATKDVIKKKNGLIKRIKNAAKEKNLNLDMQIYAKDSILAQYSYNPSLIYQLKDSKAIYGKLELPRDVKLTKIDLKMKLDWSEGLSMQSEANEIYYAIRNAMLVLLLMNKKVDNWQLNKNITNALGEDLFVKLKNDIADKNEKRLALSYLTLLTEHLENELNNPKWEKIEIKSP